MTARFGVPTEVVAAVAARFGATDPELTVLDGGSVNHTIRLDYGNHRVVLRIHRDRLRAGEFAKEAWCAEQARKMDVPTPRTLETGTVGGVPYAVQEYVEGAPAGPHGEVWAILGRWSAAIAGVPLTVGSPPGLFSRFGRDLPTAWASHIAYNRGQLGPDDPLVGLGVYPVLLAPALDRALAELAETGMHHGLSHGDLAPRNVVIGVDGPILLDWGSATTGPVPYTELLHIVDQRQSPDGPDDDDVGTYLAAAGWNDVAWTVPLAQARLLRSLDLVRWAIDQRPDLVRGYAATAHTSVLEVLPSLDAG